MHQTDLVESDGDDHATQLDEPDWVVQSEKEMEAIHNRYADEALARRIANRERKNQTLLANLRAKLRNQRDADRSASSPGGEVRLFARIKDRRKPDY